MLRRRFCRCHFQKCVVIVLGDWVRAVLHDNHRLVHFATHRPSTALGLLGLRLLTEGRAPLAFVRSGAHATWARGMVRPSGSWGPGEQCLIDAALVT
jgi:hypothetical protein